MGLALLVYLGLLGYRLGEREFWLDEQITVGHLGEGHIAFDAFHPPGYYAWLQIWSGLFGDSDAALRAFSVLCALLAALAVWLLARELLPHPHDLLALWLFVLSPVGLLYFRMARYYALTAAVALFAAWAVVLAKRHGRPGYVLLALMALHLMWVDFLPLLLLVVAYLWLLPTAWRRGKERYWWLASAAVPLAAAAWQMRGMLHKVGLVSSIPAAHPGLKQIALMLALPFYSATVGETTEPWRFAVVLPVLLAGLVLAGVGLVAAVRRKDAYRWLLVLAWPLAVGLAAAILSTVGAADPWPRVTSLCLYALPFFLGWIVLGVKTLPRWGWVLLGVVVAGQLYGDTNYLARRQFINPGYNLPWREINALVQSQGHAGDLALAYYDGTGKRYWSGVVPFVDYAEPKLPPDLPAVAAFPAGHDLWVIDRDRGASLPRDLTARLVAELQGKARGVEVARLMPYSAEERRWRSRLEGHEIPEAAVTVWRFRGGPSPTPAS